MVKNIFQLRNKKLFGDPRSITLSNSRTIPSDCLVSLGVTEASDGISESVLRFLLITLDITQLWRSSDDLNNISECQYWRRLYKYNCYQSVKTVKLLSSVWCLGVTFTVRRQACQLGQNLPISSLSSRPASSFQAAPPRGFSSEKVRKDDETQTKTDHENCLD